VAWLGEAGFEQSRVVDVTVTRTKEQRATPWMQFESLADALDPADPSLTIEGHPAPRRAVVLASA
jgi:tRNA (mo5U34)-methyltransferase